MPALYLTSNQIKILHTPAAKCKHQNPKTQIAEEITKKLRAKRARAWGKANPLETDITRENCAALGIPGYFDVIETPMNLTLIMVRAFVCVSLSLGWVVVEEAAAAAV